MPNEAVRDFVYATGFSMGYNVPRNLRSKLPDDIRARVLMVNSFQGLFFEKYADFPRRRSMQARLISEIAGSFHAEFIPEIG